MYTLAVGRLGPPHRGKQLETAAGRLPLAGWPACLAITRRSRLLVEPRTHPKYQKVKKSTISSPKGKGEYHILP